MRHGARHDRGGEVGVRAAVRKDADLHRGDDAVAREADLVVVLERMPAAGDAHVVVVGVDESRRTLRLQRDDRRDRRRMRGLAFLAAERPAHPLGDHRDLIDVQPEEMRDHMLHLGRILRRRVNGERVEFTRHGDRRLRLEVEVILPAVDPNAFDDVLGFGERALGVAAVDVADRPDEVAALLRFVDREDRLELLDVELDRLLRRLDRVAILRRDDRHRLADERDLVLGQKDLVGDDRAEEVAVEIAVGEERDDPVDRDTRADRHNRLRHWSGSDPACRP